MGYDRLGSMRLVNKRAYDRMIIGAAPAQQAIISRLQTVLQKYTEEIGKGKPLNFDEFMVVVRRAIPNIDGPGDEDEDDEDF